MVDQTPAPSSSCAQCAAVLRDAGLEQARRHAAERRIVQAEETRRHREAVLGAALLSTPPVSATVDIAALQAQLATLQAQAQRQADAAAQAVQNAQQAQTAAQAELARLRASWWYRVFHRRERS